MNPTTTIDEEIRAYPLAPVFPRITGVSIKIAGLHPANAVNHTGASVPP